jgi:hypothetical protein
VFLDFIGLCFNSAHDVDSISLDKDPPPSILEKIEDNNVKNNDERTPRGMNLS